ncbi:MAG: TldD/PmbA family protein [Mariprofundales bacterium]|nr:TldD/PmbA family protein [Mariprofundales bacterium]
MNGATEQLIAIATEAGAIHADAIAVANSGDSIAVRNGAVESVEREDSCGIGLRAFVATPAENHQKQGCGMAFATASTSDLSADGLHKLAQQVIAMARISEPDPDAVPPIGADHPSQAELHGWQQTHDHTNAGWSLEQAKAAALACEETALAYDHAINNSEGADAGFGSSHMAYCSSDGFAALYHKGSASLSVSVIAGSGEGMQRDYSWHQALHAADLHSPEQIANEAAQRVVRRLNPGTMASGKTTVVFEPRTATSLLGHLTSAINGRAVLQQRSFLTDALGQSLFPNSVCIDDIPNHPQGLGNRLFDGEGTRCHSNRLIADGVLACFLTDRYAAKRLQQPPTGSAKRGLTGDIAIGASNLIWQPGTLSQQAMVAEIGNGLLVTELIGFGINGITGDYSRGASGFLIENGILTRPVQGITIAGNLKQMFAQVTHVGADLTWFGSSAVPSIAIAGMTVAGQ